MTILAAPAAATSNTAAAALDHAQRQRLALDVLAGQSLTDLAHQHHVSRKFVAQQAQHARQAIQQAFTPTDTPDDDILFALPVTKNWLRSFMLALMLNCHSSLRGVQEILDNCFDYTVSLGTVHNVLHQAVEAARTHNRRQDLSAVRVAALDEIFQAGQAVLVGADAASTYCFLLSQEDHRDADTWAIHLWDLQQQGFAPSSTIADGGKGLRAGQARALPGTPCRADVFHAERELRQVVTFLDNRAYGLLAAADKWQRRRQQRHGRDPLAEQRYQAARQEADHAVAVADAVTVLETWLRQDILAVAGPSWDDRQTLFDFVVAQLQMLAPQCPHRLDPVCRLLRNQRDDLLAFAETLDRDLLSLAAYFRVPPSSVRALLQTQALPLTEPVRWQRLTQLRHVLGEHYQPLQALVAELAATVVRASSVVENLNSRLRTYFFLRRHLSGDYLELLRFYLNHRCFLRSGRGERVGKSPAELLSGQAHASWLELLGYRRWRRSA